jgi:hypothetical protein
MVRYLSGRLVDMDAADPKCLDCRGFDYRFQISDFMFSDFRFPISRFSDLQILASVIEYNSLNTSNVVPLRCDNVAPKYND